MKMDKSPSGRETGYAAMEEMESRDIKVGDFFEWEDDFRPGFDRLYKVEAKKESGENMCFILCWATDNRRKREIGMWKGQKVKVLTAEASEYNRCKLLGIKYVPPEKQIGIEYVHLRDIKRIV